MKVIADAGWPPLDDPRCLALRVELYKKKRRYNYKELNDGSIYIYFPRVNPISWIWQHIRYYIWTKYSKEDEDEE
jgi:hypothetical protein